MSDATTLFRLATINYLAQGGGKWPLLENKASYLDTGYLYGDAIKQFVEKCGELRGEDFSDSNQLEVPSASTEKQFSEIRLKPFVLDKSVETLSSFSPSRDRERHSSVA